MGAAGAGKSSLATQYAVAAAKRGEAVGFFVFDESVTTLYERSAALGLPLEDHVKDERVRVHHIDPAELTPGEFAHQVRWVVEGARVKLVVIDSLNGYLNAMPSEQFLKAQMHELLTYLGQQGVTTLLIMTQHGLVGGGMTSPVDASYLADSIILLRYFEATGEIRKAISVVKKRSGPHELAIRELVFGPGGVRVGGPLRKFRGILTGTPSFVGDAGSLMPEGSAPVP